MLVTGLVACSGRSRTSSTVKMLSPGEADLYAAHYRLAPLTYVARRLPPGAPPLAIDGDLTKPEWEEVPWSSDFQDIRGEDAPETAHPTDGCRTRMKMRWDDEFLYVAAQLDSGPGWPIVATFTQRNEPIFQQDSDFEVRPHLKYQRPSHSLARS